MNRSKKQDTNGIPHTNTDMYHEIFKNNISNIHIPEFFKIIIANSQTSGILIMDKEGTILGTNIGMQKSFGYSFEELVGKKMSILYTEEDRLKNLPETELSSVFQKGYARDENYCLHKDGSRIWTLGESVFTKNDLGEIFIIKFVFDINQQKLLEEHLISSNDKLNQTLDELSKVNKDLETFVYSASHDLKVPIANIEALISTLQDELTEDCKKKVEVNEILHMITISIKKFRATINDLAIIGKIQNGNGVEPEEITEVVLPELLEDIKTILLQQIKESAAIITEDLSQATSIRFSRKNLRSILLNLISNAIKYRKPNERPHITFTTEKTDEYIILKVSDNGLGIKESDKEKIFSMYKRIHNHVEGTGVGMSIVSRIVNNNGGKIEVDSKVGVGSTFKVYLKEVK